MASDQGLEQLRERLRELVRQLRRQLPRGRRRQTKNKRGINDKQGLISIGFRLTRALNILVTLSVTNYTYHFQRCPFYTNAPCFWYHKCLRFLLLKQINLAFMNMLSDIAKAQKMLSTSYIVDKGGSSRQQRKYNQRLTN